jgi:hypothetical protein
MWQQYILKQKGITFEESGYMTAEERKWWMERIEEENDRMKKASRGSRTL